ncbi:MAG: division/cell wall cluster transcriptional repressor MraZ [Lachnospiraceae bacterium]|nr:division/cell wall cluster transcriptional repressor MraZ [Lachnospiraceae bacterium]
MLLGEYHHNIDEKGRLIVPAKLRTELGESYVICRGMDGNLFMYSQIEWNKFVAQLEKLPQTDKGTRQFKRFFLGSAMEGSFDKQGRVLVSPALRGHAGLDKEIVLVGVQDKVELWAKSLWDERNMIQEEDLDAIMEHMATLDIRF